MGFIKAFRRGSVDTPPKYMVGAIVYCYSCKRVVKISERKLSDSGEVQYYHTGMTCPMEEVEHVGGKFTRALFSELEECKKLLFDIVENTPSLVLDEVDMVRRSIWDPTGSVIGSRVVGVKKKKKAAKAKGE